MAIDIREESPFSLYDLIEIERMSAKVSGLTINAVTRRSLDDDLRAEIASDGVEVF